MRRYLPRIVPAVLVLAASACETGGEPRVLSLSGSVRDYFTGTALANVTLSWGTPPRTATSSGSGAYQLGNLRETEILFISGTLANYRVTRNEPVILGTSSATADLAVVAVADAQRQYTALSLTPTAGTAVVFVNLLDGGGSPHTGIPLADVVIADTLDAPVGLGPFVFGASGDVVSQATLNVTTAFAGRARVAFLNVPPGTYQLRVGYDDAGTPRVKTAQVVAVADGASLIRR